jgi:hypothetical protein
MTRSEHTEWCKARAREYLDMGDVKGAVTSMLSDMSKHPETRGIAEKMAPVGLLYLMNRDDTGARGFVEGFN